MAAEKLTLPADPAAALAAARAASHEAPALVFKKSPICPVSFAAEGELTRWLAELAEGHPPLHVAIVDVIGEKPLARGLTKELGVQHESPQALWFEEGELRWHGSHGQLTGTRFAELLAGSAPA